MKPPSPFDTPGAIPGDLLLQMAPTTPTYARTLAMLRKVHVALADADADAAWANEIASLPVRELVVGAAENPMLARLLRLELHHRRARKVAA